MTTPDLRLKPRRRGLFAWSIWDAISVAAAFAHLGFIIWIVAGFAERPWWANLICGAGYALAASWNLNSVAHNFIHTPYFRRSALNYAFSLLLSVTLCSPQRFYRWVHLRHHQGNSDRPGADGQTHDWLSIYRYGVDGEPEAPWAYVFKGFFRSDGGDIYQALKARQPFDALFGRIELCAVVVFLAILALIDWRAVLFLVPFYYLGECLSQLNGYYEHYRGDPDQPIAWGVSSYAPIYNFLWFNNGHHAEHHYRPAVHWTQLPTLHAAVAPKQAAMGVHVIGTAHGLGFLARANQGPRRRASEQGA